MEDHALSGETCELRGLGDRAARLAEALLAERADLVRADHECAGPIGERGSLGQQGLRDRKGFAAGESGGQQRRGLAGVAALIDIGGPPRERVTQPSE